MVRGDQILERDAPDTGEKLRIFVAIIVMRPPIVRDGRPCYPRRFRLAFGRCNFFNGLAS